VRRVRDALVSAGHSTSADTVIEVLGSDLIDTVIEGNGGPRADARTAAVAIIATAQVLLESMSNELHVNGADATQGMRLAVEQVASGASGSALDDLPATTEMIYQAGIGLEAAFEITGDPRILDLLQALRDVRPGMDPALVQPLLPSDYRTALNAAISMAAAGDASVLTAVNQVARSGGSLGVDRNRPPVISGQPPTSVQVGSRYSFAPVSSDLDGDPLTFSVAGRPEWASFDVSTGRLSGTPRAGDAGTHDGIVITVSDGELTSSIGPFGISVTSNSSAPVISGTPPATAGVDQQYEFQPVVSDRDSTVFRFSIVGKPSWADFDVLSGRLSGIPSAGDVGLYRGIEISVTDGTDTAYLPAFSIEVIAIGDSTGSVTLSWVPPTRNEDGSLLVDLAGYRVYWSRDGGAYDPPVSIDNPSVTLYVVENLTPGNYEFVVTAVNLAGIESRFSNSAMKVVQ
ncbi:MAG: putative Ig domain-containing protein, partial [Woeseiaceae bacterium]